MADHTPACVQLELPLGEAVEPEVLAEAEAAILGAAWNVLRDRERREIEREALQRVGSARPDLSRWQSGKRELGDAVAAERHVILAERLSTPPR